MYAKSILSIAFCVAAAMSQTIQAIDDYHSGTGAVPMVVEDLAIVADVDDALVRMSLEITLLDSFSVKSGTTSDTMIARMAFNLPSGSVVDSLYLWVDGVPMSGFLKVPEMTDDVWNSQEVLHSPTVLTSRRVDIYDPGRGVDAYDLGVFPFIRHTSRRVKITFTTPMQVQNDTTGFALPLDIAKFCPVVERVRATVRHKGGVVAPCVSDVDKWKVSYSGDTAIARFDERDYQFSLPVYCIVDSGFADSAALSGCGGSEQDGAFFGFVNFSDIFSGADTLPVSPCEISVQAVGGGYVYDVNSPGGSKAANAVIPLSGRIRNGSVVAVLVNGTCDGRDYIFRKEFTLDSVYCDYAVGLWASSRIALAPDDFDGWNLQCALALRNRILVSGMTMLAVLSEPQDNPFARQDDLPDRTNSLGWECDHWVGHVGNIFESPVRTNSVLSTLTSGHTVRITFSGLAKLPAGVTPKLCIYDLRGRLVAELSDRLDLISGSLEWQAEGLSSGMYIVKLFAGSINLTKPFSIVQ